MGKGKGKKMAIVQEEFTRFYGPDGQPRVWLYVVYDNRNSSQESRWRVQSMRGINQDPVNSYYIYVEDPATGQQYRQTLGPSSDTIWPVPAQYQNDSPWSYNWGGGPA